MRKGFKLYVTMWGAFYAFVIIGLIVASVTFGDGIVNIGAFWGGYAGILAAFLGQFICSCLAFKEQDNQDFFYNIPILKISWSALVFMFFVSLVVMFIPGLSNLVGAFICLVILLINVVSVVKAKTAANIISDVDGKIKSHTFFIKTLTIDAQKLMSSAKSEKAKLACKKVYEAVRYSDPMSNDALASVEAQITVKFSELSEAVNADNAELVSTLANELVILVNDRNNKCRLLK